MATQVLRFAIPMNHTVEYFHVRKALLVHLDETYMYTQGEVPIWFANAYRCLGYWTKAKLLYEWFLADQQPQTNNPTVRYVVNALGLTYRLGGKLVEAERLLTVELNHLKQQEGASHPDTLTCMMNLASTYVDVGRLEEAESLYEEIVTLRKQVLGHEHLRTLASLTDLAITYAKRGRLEEAEVLCKNALVIRERVIGPEHPETMNAMNNMAYIYDTTGHLSEAAKLFRRALSLRQKVVGPDHPDTVTTAVNLLQVLLKLEDAKTLILEVMGEESVITGSESSYVLSCATDLVAAYRNTKDFGIAESLYREILKVQEYLYGTVHVDAFITKVELVRLLLLQEKGR